MPSFRASSLLAAPLALAALAALAPRPADACGGTFCDSGPQSMPVDQSGESILFVMDEGWVEAHVQIEYEGDPEQFAWIVPIMAEPEITVGSQELFDRMLASTVPTFTLNTTFEGDCSDDRPSGFGCSSVDLALSDGEGFIDEAPPNGSNQPHVAARAVVGAFEYAVLQGGTAEGVGQWLDDNGYARDDDAPEVLQTYLDEGFLFVAFKLRSGVGVDHIHPVVLRYQGTEPCIPLRLTRIAAVEDMKVRAFFLGDQRVVSSNYRHVEINPLKLDWLGLGANYDELVGEAIDEEGANGRAFVTEYAGPSSIITRAGLKSPAWDGSAFLDVTDDTLETVLNAQGFISCGDVLDDFGNPIDSQCGPTHSLIMPLVGTYMPPPDGVALEDFFECPSCFDADESTWDRAGFAEAFEEQIVEPAQHAFDVLGRNGYLTRLYTMISPGEMTTDPLFHERDDLPTVSNQWSATRVFHCEDNDRIDLDGGLTIYLDDQDQPPEFPEMSAAGRIDEFSMPGVAPMELLSFDDSETRLDEWNELHGPRNGGCECRVDSRKARGAGWLGLLLLLGVRARGRRR
ncbi:DUF2330 domain-containing protein [Paraliomyxa miuraensis]|uniref:DUF2330 domain-containing protein n=1 Tax=Paraliomyxa miuraensis TaxID=376150 RepID=UPI002250470A|nr:DUF2330 domain-containing protein [Paraliomyxa miuraensis]MCX4247997.1 DUF2330 domain-containing protein [Paraliomyxa miuraensis]